VGVSGQRGQKQRRSQLDRTDAHNVGAANLRRSPINATSSNGFESVTIMVTLPFAWRLGRRELEPAGGDENRSETNSIVPMRVVQEPPSGMVNESTPAGRVWRKCSHYGYTFGRELRVAQWSPGGDGQRLGSRPARCSMSQCR